MNTPTFSPDGRWMWDGTQWIAVPPPTDAMSPRNARAAVLLVLLLAGIGFFVLVKQGDNTRAREDQRAETTYCQTWGQNDPTCP